MSTANGTVGQSVSVVDSTNPHPLAVTIAVVNRAVRRDLDRFASVLADPVTSVRRTALADHVGFILDQLGAVQRLQDEALWPAVLNHRPHLADLADGAALAHHGLAELTELARQAALTWKRAPITRTAARTALRELAVALEPVAGQDAQTVPLACAMLSDDAPGGTRRRRGRHSTQQESTDKFCDAGAEFVSAILTRIEQADPGPVGPTKVARRLFWLLDDLPPAQARQLLARTPRWMLWVLRNGFSGAYNRAAYLMWIGGGNGPAV